MKTTLRTTIAGLSAVTVLAVSAIVAAASDPIPVPPEDSLGGGMAICAEGVPDCNDMIVDDDGQTEPGSGGGGSTGSGPITLEPDDGSLVHDVDPCGVEVVSGTGPDASVGFAPCPGDEPPPEPTPTLVTPTPGMANVYPRGFDTATVGSDGRTVTIDFVSGIEPCYVLDHVDVRYGTDAVTITLFEGSQPTDEPVACIEIGVFKRTIVTLDQPLGDRTIIDGAA